MGCAGVGERSFLVTEQFAFEERLGEGGAVHGDERLVAPRAVIVQRLCDNLFTSSAGAENQHRQISRSQSFDFLTHRLGRGAVTDDPHAAGHLLGQLPMRPDQSLAFASIPKRDCRLNSKLSENVLVVVIEQSVQLVYALKRADQPTVTV